MATSFDMGATPAEDQKLDCFFPGSEISNGREPKSLNGRVLNSKLGFTGILHGEHVGRVGV
jgi:hypothetical protein